nr:hypothetical protein [Nanoarchaeum sp.]
MIKYDTLYCSTTEKVGGDVKRLRNYLRDTKWLALHEERGVGDSTLIHFVRDSGSISFYRGNDWLHLSAVDLSGTKTIDELIEKNSFLNEQNAESHIRQTIDNLQ